MKCYDRKGRLISDERWGELHRIPEYVILAKTDVGNYLVSTVWLGMDHNFDPGGLPVIYESMVFDKNGDEVDCRRYTDEEEAMKGHDEMVADTTDRWNREKP